MDQFRNHLGDILTPFQQLDVIREELTKEIPEDVLPLLCKAWHHNHYTYQTKKRTLQYHRQERAELLGFLAEYLPEKEFKSMKENVFYKLDSIIRASSLIEMINSLLRPYLNQRKGQITQEDLNLIQFYLNHRPYKRGKREAKSPLELLTGVKNDSDWVTLLIKEVKRAGEKPSKDKLISIEPYLEQKQEDLDKDSLLNVA